MEVPFDVDPRPAGDVLRARFADVEAGGSAFTNTRLPLSSKMVAICALAGKAHNITMPASRPNAALEGRFIPLFLGRQKRSTSCF